MRAAAILGLGCSARDLKPFQTDNSVEWRIGMPASPDNADVILLFGGDGTVHRHLGQLVKLGLPVLVVPAGSGNDFARALGPRRVHDSLSAWRKFCGGNGDVRAIDLGVITPCEREGAAGLNLHESEIPMSRKTGETWGIPGWRAGVPAPRETYFCCVAGVGLDSEVARRANRLPRWLRGNGGYALSLAPTIFTFDPVPVKIFAPEGVDEGWALRSDGPTMLAAFANTPVYGGGMKIAPRAKMDDGLLDVCVVGAVSPMKLFSLFPTVYAGKHLSIREVEYFQAPRVRVETEQAQDIYADGEYVCQTPVDVSIERAALRVVTASR